VAVDVVEMADRLWRGEVDPWSEYHPVGHLGGMAEICQGVAFVPTLANVTAITTDDGLVLIDTGSEPVAPLIHTELRRWSDQRLNTAVFSHGHIDHVFGVGVWERSRRRRGGLHRSSSPMRRFGTASTATSRPPATTRSLTGASSASRTSSGRRHTVTPTRPTGLGAPSMSAACTSTSSTRRARPTTTR